MRKIFKLLTTVVLTASLLPSSVPYIAGASPVKTQESAETLASTRQVQADAGNTTHTKEEILNQIDKINSLRKATDNYTYKGTDGAITWTIDRYGVLTLTGNGDYSNVTSDYAYPKWYTYRSSIKSAVIAITGIH